MVAYRCTHLLTPRGALRGEVLVENGRVAAVREVDARRRAPETGETRDLGRAVVMPGLVNAHTHLELSWMGEDRPVGGDYVDWLRDLLRKRAVFETRDDAVARAAEAARAAAASMRARGTVAAGDVCNGTAAAAAWAGSGIEGVLFLELLGADGREAERIVAAARARVEAAAAPDGWRWSLAPHAPHTTSSTLMAALARDARERDLPCSIHLAESEAEELFLAGRGPFVELFAERGFLPPGHRPDGRSPTARAAAAGLLAPGTLLVHAVRVAGADLERIVGGGATVVTCPRSNAYLNVGVAPLERYAAAGVPWAIGTDSLASAPDLDLFAEMAALRELHPDIAAEAIVSAATLGGARALGLADRFGTIEPGKRAALVAVPLPAGADPYETLCGAPHAVYRIEDAPWETAR